MYRAVRKSLGNDLAAPKYYANKLPVKLGLMEKLVHVFESSFSSVDDLKKKYV